MTSGGPGSLCGRADRELRAMVGGARRRPSPVRVVARPRVPLGVWDVSTAAMPSVEDDPSVAGRVEDCGPPGRMSFSAAVDMTCTPDVLVHTWDLARAAGLTEHEQLDADEVRRQVAAVESIPPEVDAAIRASGHFGPRVDVPADADEQTRLLAFNGRRA